MAELSYEGFVCDVWKDVAKCPKSWRKGQAVFNVIEEAFGDLARIVQFEDRVDCFYDDSKIDEFLDRVWKRLEIGETKIEEEVKRTKWARGCC